MYQQSHHDGFNVDFFLGIFRRCCLISDKENEMFGVFNGILGDGTDYVVFFTTTWNVLLSIPQNGGQTLAPPPKKPHIPAMVKEKQVILASELSRDFSLATFSSPLW